MSEKNLKKKIKEMEQQSRAQVVETTANADEVKVNFDTWYYIRSPQIPERHRKEILLSYFKSLKMTINETMQAYDDALARYGVKINK
jgi:hypothetical protein